MDLLQRTLLRRARLTGRAVFFSLLIVSVVEYWLSVTGASGLLFWLVVIAIAKTWLIAQFFMHITHAWRGEEHGHD